MLWTGNSNESSYESPNLLANIDSIKNAGMLEHGRGGGFCADIIMRRRRKIG